MSCLISKLNHLILDRWAVPGSHSINHACIERGKVEVLANDRVRFFGGEGNPARDLFHMEHSIMEVIERVKIMMTFFNGFRNVREERFRCISVLSFTAGEINRFGQQAARGPCLETPHFKT